VGKGWGGAEWRLPKVSNGKTVAQKQRKACHGCKIVAVFRLKAKGLK